MGHRIDVAVGMMEDCRRHYSGTIDDSKCLCKTLHIVRLFRRRVTGASLSARRFYLNRETLSFGTMKCVERPRKLCQAAAS